MDKAVTRRPRRSFLRVTLGSLLFGCAAVRVHSLREEVDEPILFFAVALFFVGSFLAVLSTVLLPPRTEVAPDPTHAGFAAVAATLASLTVLSTLASHSSDTAGSTPGAILRCALLAGTTAAVPWLLCRRELRGAIYLARGRIGAAAGAAGAAAGAAVLHLCCASQEAEHLLLGHGGAFVSSVIAGGLVGRMLSGPAKGS